MSKTSTLVRRIESAGFSRGFVQSCLPDWWDEQAEESESAWLHMQLGLAERLSLDPISLLDETAPLQLSDVGRAKFKHLRLSHQRQYALEGFALGLARLLLAAFPEPSFDIPRSAAQLRAHLLPPEGYIGLGELLAFCFSAGLPVAHVAALPAGQRGVAAIATAPTARAAIFTARKPLHAAQLLFFIAHELGHVALGHVAPGRALIEGDLLNLPEGTEPTFKDNEEQDADEFALELLTGGRTFEVSGPMDRGTAAELCQVAIETGQHVRVDPGLLILCFGRSTGRWPLTTAALKRLPNPSTNVVAEINRALRSQLSSELLTPSDQAYLNMVAPV